MFSVAQPLSVADFGLESLISIYPNPTKDNLTIVLNNVNENVNYEIFNTLGQQMAKGNLVANSTHTLQMSSYQTGIYFVKLSTNTHTMTKKLIKE